MTAAEAAERAAVALKKQLDGIVLIQKRWRGVMARKLVREYRVKRLFAVKVGWGVPLSVLFCPVRSCLVSSCPVLPCLTR